jgi:hypothetical protein
MESPKGSEYCACGVWRWYPSEGIQRELAPFLEAESAVPLQKGNVYRPRRDRDNRQDFYSGKTAVVIFTSAPHRERA